MSGVISLLRLSLMSLRSEIINKELFPAGFSRSPILETLWLTKSRNTMYSEICVYSCIYVIFFVFDNTSKNIYIMESF